MIKIRQIILLLIVAGVVSDGCDRSTRPTASEELTALFTLDKRSYETGDTVDFLNKSTGYSSMHWNLGDGTTSAARSPKHIYTAPGDYFPELTVRQSGQHETFSMKITITGQPITDHTSSAEREEETIGDDEKDVRTAEDERTYKYTINLDKQVAATGTRIFFGTDARDTLIWNLDDMNRFTGADGSVVYKIPGKKTVFLSSPGREDTLAKTTIQIYNVGTIPSTVKTGDPVILKAEGDLPIKWEINDGRSFREKLTTVSFDNSGTFRVRLLNENDNSTLYQSTITVKNPVVITTQKIDQMLNRLANAGLSMSEKDNVASDLRNYCVKGGNTEVGGKASGSLDEFIIKLRIEATKYVKVSIKCDLEYDNSQKVSKIIVSGITSTDV